MSCRSRTVPRKTIATREKTNHRRASRHRTSLRPLAEPLEAKIAPAVFTWTGAGGLLADGWSNTGNWQVGGSQPALPPGAGDQLVFPTGVTQQTADNNLGTNISFQSITIEDTGYDVYGDRLNLTGMLSLTATSASCTYEIATTYLGSSAISVASGSQLSVSGHTTLASDTTVEADSGATVILNTDIVQNGSEYTLTKSGPGTMIISATYLGSYGPTDVTGGTLQVDGALDPTQPVTIESGATLSGIGSVGPVTSAGGIIAPGDGGPGILTVAGLDLTMGTQFQVDLDGNTPGTGYDQVISSGPVDLAGVTLDPTVFGYTAMSGDQLMLIENNSGSGISGTFVNYGTEMGLVTVGTPPSVDSFLIDYQGLNQTGDNLVLDGLNPTTTGVNASAGPYTYGNTITFTANVSDPGVPVPSGTVDLFDNTTMIGSQSLSAGTAAFNISTLNAGLHNDLYVDYLGDNTFAPSQSSALSLTIAPRPITVTAAGDTKTYDGTTISTGVPTITAGSLANSDTADFTQAFDSRDAGPRTLSAIGIANDGNDGLNYSYTFLTAAGTINPSAITVTAASDTKTYDGTTSSTAVPIIVGALGVGDTPDFSQVFDSRNAGSRNLTASGIVNDGNGGNNYTYTFETAPGTINPLAITVTAASDTKTYDGTTASTGVPTITSGSLAAGDTTTTFTQAFVSRNAGPESLLASGIVNDGNGGNNYSYTFVSAAGTITPLAISVTAASDSKPYDGTTTSSGVPAITSGSLATGDTTTTFTQVFASRNAGSEELIASGIVNDGNGGNNYSYTFVPAAGTITQLAITVTAASDSKAYDGTTDSAGVPTITSGSLAAGDTPDFTQVFASRNAGPESVSAGGIVSDGNGGNNYSYTFVPAAGTITPLAITVTAASDTKTYDGTATSLAMPIVTPGLGAGDSPEFMQTFDSRNVGPRTLLASGTVNDGNGGNNYTYTFVTAAGTIAPLAITVTAANDTKTYDGTTASTGIPTITSGSLALGDTTTTFTEVFDSRNAGSRTLIASGLVNDGNGGNNYSYTFVPAAGTITPLAITVTAASDSKTYDGTTTSSGVPTITSGSLATGDTTTTFTQVFASRNAGSEELLASGIVNDGNGGNNYGYTFVPAAGTITPLAITVTAASDSKTYDGTTDSAGVPTITSGSLAAGDTPDFTQVFASRNAGPESVSASGIVSDGNGGNNYSYTFVPAAGTITPLAITVTAASDTKTYDGTTTSSAMPIVTPGLGAGDTPEFTQTFDSRNVGPRTLLASGTVNDGNGGNNYTYNFVTAAGTISPLAITVTAASDTKTYDGTTTSTGVPTITSGGLAAGDTTTTFTQAFASRNAGPENLTASGLVNDGNGGNNYSYTFVPAAGTITPLAITVTAASDSKAYDGTTNSAGVPAITSGGLATGDTTTTFTQVFASGNAGPEELIASGIVNDGNGGNNYSYTFVPAAGTITPLAITVTAASDTKTYDGTINSAGVPTITSGSLATGDTTTTFTQVFASRNAGPGMLIASGIVNDGNGGNNYTYTFILTAGTINPLPITVTAASDTKTYDGTTNSTGVPLVTPGLGAGDTPEFTQSFDSPDVGARTLIATGTVNDGNGGNNYIYTFETAPGAINSVSLSVTVDPDQSKVYGSTDPAFTYQLTSGSLVEGDSLSGSLTRQPGENVGVYAITQGTLTAGPNYAIVFAGANFTITPRLITVTAATDTKVYDGTTNSSAVPTITAGTLAFEDVANFSESFGTRNAGTGLTLTPAGSVSDGNGGNNYAVTFVDDTTGVINAAAITVAATADSKTYDGTTTASVAPTITVGTIEPGDVADFTESFATRNVGTGETLVPSGSVNDGNGGNNYTVTFVDNTTGVITPLALLVTAAMDSKLYDGTTTSTALPIITGTLAFGDVANFTEAFDSPNVGFRTLTPSGIVNDGNGGANYSYTYVAAPGTINQRGITVTANSGQTKVYGNSDPTLTYQLTSGSLVAGDSLTGGMSRASGENVGGYTILQGTLTAGPNYALSFVAATFTITPRAITVAAAPDTKVYDGTTASSASPSITSGSLAFADVANFSQVYSDKNAGTAKMLVPSGSVSDGNGGNNYAVTFLDNTTGVITARPLTVAAGTDNRIYDGTTSSSVIPAITSGSLAVGDVAEFSESFDTRDVGVGKTLTPSGSVNDGNGGNNYAVTFVASSTGAITARPITVTAIAATKPYDGTTSSSAVPAITSGSVAAGDTADFTESYDTSNVGTGKTLTPAGSVNDGNGGNNYSVTFVTNSTGVITQRAVTVTADPKTKLIGQPDPALTYQVTSGSLLPGDSFSGALTRVPGETSGSYPILQGTLALDSNYALTYVGANLTVLPLGGTKTTILGSSHSASNFGQLVSITAEVVPTSGAGTPTGIVIFMDGSTVLGTSPVDGSLAVFDTTALVVGSHTIVAIYEGDGSDSLSQSPNFNQTVAPASTETTLSIDPSANHRGVTLEAEVSPIFPGGGVPSGSIVFTVNGHRGRTVRLVNGTAELYTSSARVMRKWLGANFVGNTNSYKPSNSRLVYAAPRLLKGLPALRTVRLDKERAIEARIRSSR